MGERFRRVRNRKSGGGSPAQEWRPITRAHARIQYPTLQKGRRLVFGPERPLRGEGPSEQVGILGTAYPGVTHDTRARAY